MSKSSSKMNSKHVSEPLEETAWERALGPEPPLHTTSNSASSTNGLKQLVFQFLLDYEAERNLELQKRLGLIPSRKRRSSPDDSPAIPGHPIVDED